MFTSNLGITFVFCAFFIGTTATPTAAATTSINRITPICMSANTMACRPAPLKNAEFNALMSEVRMNMEQVVLASTLPLDMGFTTLSADCCRMRPRMGYTAKTGPALQVISFIILVTSMVLGCATAARVRKAARRRQRRYTINRSNPRAIPRVLISWIKPLRRRDPRPQTAA